MAGLAELAVNARDKRLGRPVVLVRFESARGVTGVPKVWLVVDATDIGMLIREAVELLRIRCELPGAHGRDLMPPLDGEYRLHNVDGGVVQTFSDVAWAHDENGQPTTAELALTYGLPSLLLAQQIDNST